MAWASGSVMQRTSSEAGFVEFGGDATDDIVEHLLNTGLGSGADVEFRVVKFWVAREVVVIVVVLRRDAVGKAVVVVDVVVQPRSCVAK